jgi:hypothetical protein
MKQRALLGLLLVCVVAFFVARYFSSDERAVERVLRELVGGARVSREESSAARITRLSSLLDETTSPLLSVQSTDLPPAPAGRAALLTWAAMLEGVDDAALELVDPRIRVEGRRAQVQTDVVFKAHAAGDEWTDRRAVAFVLEKLERGWRVRSIDVGARPNDLPEARP